MHKMLRQRLDRQKWLLAPSPLPVGQQLVLMECGPLDHQRERAPRKRAGDEFAIDPNRRRLAG
jgi:hypothetical protein